MEPDTDVFEGVINHKSLHLKHMNSVKIPGNFSASEIFYVPYLGPNRGT